MKRFIILSGAVVVAAALTAVAFADDNGSGFQTSRPSMLTPVGAGRDGEADHHGRRHAQRAATASRRSRTGSRVRTRGHGRVDLYVNHETAKVPFPYNTAAPTAANGENDFDNAQVSQLILNQHSAGVLNGSFVDPEQLGLPAVLLELPRDGEGGFRPRASCSRMRRHPTTSSVGRRRGRRRSAPPPSARPASWSRSTSRTASTTRSGDGPPQPREQCRDPGIRRPRRALGRRHVHERPAHGVSRRARLAVAAVLVHRADTDALLADEGDLWAFVSDTPGVDELLRLHAGFGAVVTGHFVKVPKDIATGLNADGTEDQGGRHRASRSRRRRHLAARPAAPPVGIDGPQWVLEYWSEINNVFQFVRVEDIAYDKRPGMGNSCTSPTPVGAGRPRDASTRRFRSTNGRVWRLVLDPSTRRR